MKQPGAWEPSAHSWDINFHSLHRSFLAKWHHDFCEESGFTGFPLLSAFPASLLLPFSFSLVTLQKAFASKEGFDGNKDLLMWKWVNRSTQLVFPLSMLTWVPSVALLLEVFTSYWIVLVWHSKLWMALHTPFSDLTPICAFLMVIYWQPLCLCWGEVIVN